ncbi:MAG TPA: hypothetical protein VHS99_02685, partial [Chloroflexota bacterium]|nr:hypothetical protein [Chloroflexota bacterium]
TRNCELGTRNSSRSEAEDVPFQQACLDPSTRLAEADLLEGDILRLAARGVPGSEFTVPS